MGFHELASQKYRQGTPRVRAWLREKAFPLWSSAGVDWHHGGFHEALALDTAGEVHNHNDALPIPKRIRTMARQVYAFSQGKSLGLYEDQLGVISHGIDFIETLRLPHGGYAHSIRGKDAVEASRRDTIEAECYDYACILLAYAHAAKSGHRNALQLGQDLFAYIDDNLADSIHGGFLERRGEVAPRLSNSHMHLLEACIAWYDTTGDPAYLMRANAIIQLFTRYFFNPKTWSLAEYYDHGWRPLKDDRLSLKDQDWMEPGHHFEWASLIVAYAARTGNNWLIQPARKLYATALAHGINRHTGLVFSRVSTLGHPIELHSRSWCQAEALKATLALSRTDGPDMRPEITARVNTLFFWHLDPAPDGLWIDRIEASGALPKQHVPASILYHLVSAFACYLQNGSDFTVKPAYISGYRASLRKSHGPSPSRRHTH